MGKKAAKKAEAEDVEPEPVAQAEDDEEIVVVKAKKKKKDNKSQNRLINGGANVVTVLILVYAVFVGNKFRQILYPKFPDEGQKFHNVFQDHDKMTARLWVASTPFPKAPPMAEFEFEYFWGSFEERLQKFNVTLDQKALKKGQNVVLSAEVVHQKSGGAVRAKGNVVKQVKKPEIPARYKLLTGTECPAHVEPAFGKKTHIARGIPKMQVRLVYDQTAYPHPYRRGDWGPELFVDEFGMNDEDLVKLNDTITNEWESEFSFTLMSAARRRFQQHMEFSFTQNAKLFGEDSEEMLQMKDMFANTNSYLLVATLCVSVLHMIFEFLAFKNDVIFFQGCDTESLNKFISIRSIAWGILAQIIILMYLCDEGSNILVVITSVVAILIDAWKVKKAMKIEWVWVLKVLPLPTMVSKVQIQKADDYDSIAMKWLALGLSPAVFGYGVYTLVADCHKSWYSYGLTFLAMSVYSLGFVLLTPQIFINYKHKTVAFLPWRKFIYRALNTFIDDLFAFIIRMPTMHRLSCFRDDIVFLVYLYQRHIYPIDKDRTFDEDGFELADGAEEEKKEEKKTK